MTVHSSRHWHIPAYDAVALDQASLGDALTFLEAGGPHVLQHLQKISADPTRKVLIDQTQDALKEISQIADQIRQQLEQQMQEQAQLNQGNGEPMNVKDQLAIRKAALNEKIKTSKAQLDAQLKTARAAQDMQITQEKAQQDLGIADAKTASAIMQQTRRNQKTETE